MGKSCVVTWCGSSRKRTPEKSFFGFPKADKSPEEHFIWKNILGLDVDVGKDAVVCSDHFRCEDIDVAVRSRLRTGATPKGLDDFTTHTVKIAIGSETSATHYVQVNDYCLQIVVTKATPEEDVSKGLQYAVEAGIKKRATEDDQRSIVHRHRRQVKDLQEKLSCARKSHMKSARARNVWRKAYQELLAKFRKATSQLNALRMKSSADIKKVHDLYQEKMGKFLSANQIRKVMSNSKRHWIWSDEDISSAIALRFVSNPYQELRKRNFPLPAIRTLQSHASKIECKPGIQHAVLKLIKYKFQTARQIVRECVILFDEVSINPNCEYDPESDRIYANCSNLQVVLVRGLYYKWQQMVSYEFNQKFTAEEFKTLVSAIEDTGLIVRAVVSDNGTKNVGLNKSLGVGVKIANGEILVQNSIRSNQHSNHHIYFLADAPHLIKALRNNVLNTGILLPGGYSIRRRDFEELLEKSNQVKECWKLTTSHLDLQHKDKMRVYLAAQLFSKTVARHWRKHFPSRVVEAEFIELVNDWFDVMNSRHLSDLVQLKQPYGYHLKEQEYTITTMEKVMKGLRVYKKDGSGYHNHLYPFQKGFLLTSRSVRELFRDMISTPIQIKYLLTAHLNQDILESFFAQLRSMRGFNNNPTAVDAMRRLKILMFTKSKSLSKATNIRQDCEEDSVPSLTADMLHELKRNSGKEKEAFDVSEKIQGEVEVEEMSVDNADSMSKEWSPEQDCLEAGLEYIAGYVASKLYGSHPYLVASNEEISALESSSWIVALDKQTLRMPSLKCRNDIRLLNQEFVKYHAHESNTFSPGVEKGLTSALSLKYSDIPKLVISTFIKTRTRILMKDINQKIKDKTMEKETLVKKRALAIRSTFIQASTRHNLVDEPEEDDLVDADLYNPKTLVPNYFDLYNNNDFSWSKTVARVAETFLGPNELKPLQRASINAILTGVNIFLISGTGSGKSLVYQVSALVSSGVTIVVSPLISLIQNQLSQVRNLGIKAASFSMDQGYEVEQSVYQQIEDTNSGIKLVFVTPEKITNCVQFNSFLKRLASCGRLDKFTIDELHCVRDWGNLFRPAYLGLKKLRQDFENVPVLGLTATASPSDIEEIKSMLFLQDVVIFRDVCYRPNLEYQAVFCEESKKESLVIAAVKNHLADSGIIYCSTRKACDRLHKILSDNGISSQVYHADVGHSTRRSVLDNWISGATKVVVATVAFGMGIDKPNCRFVFHYSLPSSISSYVQESGRAGRDGLPSKCVIFASSEDISRSLANSAFDTTTEKYRNVIDFVIENSLCRAKYIAKYFEDPVDSINCFCSVCCNEDEQLPSCVTQIFRDIVLILNIAKDSGQNMTAKMLLNVLLGKSRSGLYRGKFQLTGIDSLTLEKIVWKAYVYKIIEEVFDPLPTRTICYFKPGVESHVLVRKEFYMVI